MKGLRVGLPVEYFDDALDPGIDRVIRSAAKRLESEGASVEEVSLPHTRYSIPTYYLMAAAEASSNLARFDGVRYGRRGSGDEGLAAMYCRSRTAGLLLRQGSAGAHPAAARLHRGLRLRHRRAARPGHTDGRVPSR